MSNAVLTTVLGEEKAFSSLKLWSALHVTAENLREEKKLDVKISDSSKKATSVKNLPAVKNDTKIIDGVFKEIKEKKPEEKVTPFKFTKSEDNTFVFVNGEAVPVSALNDVRNMQNDADEASVQKKEMIDRIEALIKENLSNAINHYLTEDPVTGMISLFVVRNNGYTENYMIDPCGLCWGQGTEPRISANIGNAGEWTFVPMTMAETCKKVLESKFYILSTDEIKELEEKFLPAEYCRFIDLHDVKEIANKEKFKKNVSKVINKSIEDSNEANENYPRFRLAYHNEDRFSLISDDKCITPLPGLMSTYIKQGLRYDYNNGKIVKSMAEEV